VIGEIGLHLNAKPFVLVLECESSCTSSVEHLYEFNFKFNMPVDCP